MSAPPLQRSMMMKHLIKVVLTTHLVQSSALLPACMRGRGLAARPTGLGAGAPPETRGKHWLGGW